MSNNNKFNSINKMNEYNKFLCVLDKNKKNENLKNETIEGSTIEKIIKIIENNYKDKKYKSQKFWTERINKLLSKILQNLRLNIKSHLFVSGVNGHLHMNKTIMI
jgi:hypothetical protein